jgi:hypothetical protein
MDVLPTTTMLRTSSATVARRCVQAIMVVWQMESLFWFLCIEIICMHVLYAFIVLIWCVLVVCMHGEIEEIENVCMQCARPHLMEVSSSDEGVVCGWVFCRVAWTTMLCQLRRVREALVEHVYTHCWSTLYANWWLSILLKHSKTASASASASHQRVTIGRSRIKFLFHINASPFGIWKFLCIFQAP